MNRLRTLLGSGPKPTASFLLTALLLVVALIPLPSGRVRSTRQSARSLELNHIDRESGSVGYYNGLLDLGSDGTRSELALRLLGKPESWVRIHDVGAIHNMPHDVLQFELKPNLNMTLFGQPFTTDRYGLRDRDYARHKPSGVFRIVLLGSSMDMGWGVGTEAIYSNRLEDWLNLHAALRGLDRRFEVLNFAVAAYSPLQRFESYRRKAERFEPDLVIYSATMLDTRLMQLHLCSLFQERVRLDRDAFLRKGLDRTGLTHEDLRLDSDGELAHRTTVKDKLRPELWALTDLCVGRLAAECRADGVPLVYMLIPRVGPSDEPDARAPAVARHHAVAAHHALTMLDLSDTFDDEDPADLEIAPWDDHPNVRGHKLLFQALAHAIVDDPALYQLLFDPASEPSAARPGLVDGSKRRSVTTTK